MFNRFKKFISLILCAALLNACVLPSTALFAAKSPVTKKQQAKPVEPKSDSAKATTDRSEEEEDLDKENPTISESWQKVVNFEWKEFTKADGWNIVKSAGGTALTLAIAYALFKSKPATGTSSNINPTHDMPDDKPNIIPAIPTALQDIINNDQYGPEYTQKIKGICNTDYRKQLQTQGLNDLQNQLIKDIAQTSNSSIENKKQLIDNQNDILQKHLKDGIIKNKLTDSLSTDKTKEEEKPKSLYPFAEQAQKNKALADVTVPHQEGLLCAIHALYDGNYINEKLIQDNTTTVENLNNLPLLAEQISQERIKTDFDTHCKNWTGQTARKRKAAASEKYISHQLHRCMTLTQEEQGAQSGFFNYIFSLINGSTLHTLTSKENNSRVLITSILKEVITQGAGPQGILLWDDSDNINLEELYNVILNLANQCHRNLDDIQKADLSAFINSLDTAKLKTNFNGTLINDETKAKSHVRSYYPHLSTDFTGENLDSQELEILIEQMGKNVEFAYDNKGDLIINAFNGHNPETYIYDLNGKISIINDTANIIPDSRDGTIIAVIKHQMSQCNKFVHTFMIRLGAVKVGSASSTHWISVTLVRFNNKNHYFITDSMNTEYANKSNLQLNIKQLIEALEQPNILQLEQAEEFDIISDDVTPNNNSITDNNNALTDNATTNDIAQALTNALNNVISAKSKSIKNGANTVAQKEIVIRPSANPQKIASIPTLAQSGNSCAYHALRNANDIVCILKTPQIQDMEDNFDFEAIATRIGNTLCGNTSRTKVITLFNEKIEQKECGEWRQIIKTKRLPDALKESIYNKLLQSVPRSKEQITRHNERITTYETSKAKWDERKQKRGGYHKDDPMPQKPILLLSNVIDETVRACFRNIAHGCTTQLANDPDNTIVLTDIAHLPEILINIVRTTNRGLLQDREETFNGCIALLNADELAKNFGDAITAATAMRNNNQRVRELIGNDLDADELQYLLDNGNIENAQNISIITRTETSDFAGENSYALSDALPLVKVKMLGDNCSHAFLIRSGFSKEINHFQDEINQSNNGTHWICVVLYRVNGHNHYIIADSLTSEKANLTNTLLNKNNRTTDNDVNYLIAMLES